MARTSSLRITLALVWVVVAIACIVRNTFVAIYSDTDLKLAERLWPDHPTVLSARAMLEVAQAAARGRKLESGTQSLVYAIARAEPLAPEPFLIMGAEAQRTVNARKAEALLVRAERRDPRAPAAHFLLAQQYIAEGRVREGVPEAAVLGRLVPGSVEPLSQAFARYIEAAGIPDGMAEVMRSNPDLSQRILNELAANTANADLLLRIAALSPPSAPGRAPGWQSGLINGLVADGDYARARQVWAKLTGPAANPSETIHDPRFEGSNAPPPFNWTFAGQGAVIEPQAGSLHVLYFGRDSLGLASQLLVLRPGRYRLQMQVLGQVADPEGLRWRIDCLPGKAVILDRPAAPGKLDLSFTVPSQGCGAQWLELVGQGGEAGSSDFLISSLGLAEGSAQ